MISCSLLSLKALAAQRGYAFESVRNCIIDTNPDGTVVVDETHPDYPKAGLGDLIAAGLSAAGITKELVGRLVGKDCGCQKRQQWLNKVGQRYLGIGHTPSPPTGD